MRVNTIYNVVIINRRTNDFEIVKGEFRSKGRAYQYRWTIEKEIRREDRHQDFMVRVVETNPDEPIINILDRLENIIPDYLDF